MGENIDKNRKQAKGFCPRCNSSNIFLSKFRGIDGVISAFLPSNVYRCLDCNKRFWAPEALLANTSRAWTWALTLLTVLVILYLIVQPGRVEQDVNRHAGFVPQFDSPSELDLVDVEKTGDSGSSSLTAVLKDASIESKDIVEPLLELGSDEAASTLEVNQAKVQSEKITSASKASMQRLESAIDKDEQALASLLKIDINYVIDGWRKSWESGLVTDYLNSYSQNFIPNDGLSFDLWQKERKDIVQPGKQLIIELTNFDVSFANENTRATAIFTQSYTSSKYSEVSRKKLDLVNEQGVWKIISEVQTDE